MRVQSSFAPVCNLLVTLAAVCRPPRRGRGLAGLLAAALLAGALPAPAALLFDRGHAGWAWRPGITEASAPVSAWRNIGFNTAEFTNAPAPFWFGDALPGGTQINGMLNVYTSLFLRATFVITNLSEVSYLRLGAAVDDGLVAWINGTEVRRVRVAGAAGDPVSVAMLGENAPEPPPFDLFNLTSPLPSSYLVLGTNVLAVQVFQSSAGSSDLGFDASLEIIPPDNTPPAVQGASPVAGGTVSALSTITVTFSEPVTGVDAGDLLVNGVAAATLTPVSSTVYSFGFTQPAFGTVTITWAGGHGIADQALSPNAFDGGASTWQYTLVDQVAPAVASLSPVAGATVLSLSNIAVQFSEDVNGVDAGDLLINNTPATGLSGGGSLFTFTFSPPATGLVQVAWAVGHGITDQAASPNAFAGGNWLYTFDPNASLGGGPYISEFMAANAGSGALLDEDGESSDWIEIHNDSILPVNLLNWSLTDSSGDLTKWRFPATNLPPDAFLVVFASEKNRRVPGRRLHTNFKLDSGGEYLALVRPDGSIATEFNPYHVQIAGVSFGFGVFSTNSTLVSTTAAARVQIPASGADGTNWLYAAFNDAAWTAGTNGVGYGTTNVTQADYSATVLPMGPLVYYRMSETAGTTAANAGSLGAPGNGSYINSPTLDAAGPRPPAFLGFEANNRAVQLSGTAATDYVQGPAGLLTSRTAFTIAGWINPTAAQAARTGLFGQNDTVEFGFISAGTIQAWTPSGSIAAYTYPHGNNEWHHIALVGSGGQFTIYVDGTARISAAAVAGGAAGNFNIGGGGIFDATGNDFVGLMDEVAMWDRALSAAELLSLYTAGTNPAGYSVVPYVRTDVAAAMSNVNASAYVRLPFTIDNPGNVQLLRLNVRHDDGFVAYLNGVEVARANAPATPLYNSAATNTHTVATVDQFQFGAAMLAPGANLLAIHALNASAADEDFLILAELTATHEAAASTEGVYMTGPTPGSANAGGVSVLGPAITELAHAPVVPTDAQDIVVTARVSPTFAPVSAVAVRYRVMFGAESELAMNDSGTNGDVTLGDGVFSATLPIAAASTNGQMIRWYFRATDALNRVSRWPLFTSAVEEEYLGTVVNPAYVTTPLPVFHLFVAPSQVAGIDTEAGGRIAVYWDGEFYDNVYMELRGNTSATLPKKAHRLEFNRNHEFRHPGYDDRVRKSSLLAEYPDPSRLRQHLSFWFLDKIGVPSPFDYPVRVQTNGVFYQIAFHNDVVGQEQIERMGFDPRGALYKAVGNADVDRSSTGGFQKLEPDPPDTSTADYDELAFNINENRDATTRRNAVFDRFDVPHIINHLAGNRFVSENDDVWANMCLYRDTYGDQLWRTIPFDMNPSWGQRYGGVATLEASVDTQKSHPLYGGRAIRPIEGGPADYYNRVYDVIISVPEVREMYLRRMRTVLDKWVFPPGTPTNQLIIENYIKSLTNLMGTDMLLEAPPRWPAFSAWGPVEAFVPACANILNNFVPQRRTHWYVTHCITNASVAFPLGINSNQCAGIPLTQPAQPSILMGALDFNPANSNQLHEFVSFTNPNPYAVDITGWRVSGGARFTFKPGTVIPSNGVIYISPNVVSFKQRAVSPTGNEGRFVVGPYDGQLNARGESIVLRDDTGALISSNSFIGLPSPAQLYLRVTEIMYNPSPLAGNTNDAQEFEYLELKNISGDVTLDLGGVRLTNGVDFNFTGSAVTSLAPGASVLVVRNAAAFAARYGALPNVAGQFAGALDSGGEVIRLDDARGEKILEFDYNNTWYPITDGHGFSLVIVDENAAWDTWGMKSSWRPSGVYQGSPGATDPAAPVIAGIIVNEVLTHSDPPLVDRVELWNPTASAVNIGGWLLTDDFTNAHKYRFPDPTVIDAGDYLTVDEGQFNTPSNAPGSFAFGSDGDEVYLFSANPATTNLTGYFQGFDFGAAESGVSFGRYTNSQTNVHFVAQSVNTLGLQNAAPKVGPVVISEVMYRPPDLAGGADNADEEFVELLNLTGSPLPLFDPAHATNTWRLRSAVDFDFPGGVTLAANGTLMVVNFNPTNAALLASFRARFSVPESVPVLGPWSGQLNNSGESVRLFKPDAPLAGVAPYVLVDRVDYGDVAPWPAAADGLGGSLQRLVQSAYGNDPTNWVGAAPTGGGGYVPGGVPPSVTAPPSSQSVPVGGTATFGVSVSGTPPFAYQWQFNSNNISGANGSVLVLTNVQLTSAGYYRVAILGAGGFVQSADALLTVFVPASITAQPPNRFVRLAPDPFATNATNRAVSFSVSATSPNGPLAYHWRLNGTNLPPAHPDYLGVNGTTLTVTNISFAHVGWYSCLVSDANGSIPTLDAALGVSPFLLGVTPPLTIAAGSDISVSAAMQAWPPPFLFRWGRASIVNTNIVSGEGTNFATWNAAATGYTNTTGSLSNSYPLRLTFTNLAVSASGIAPLNQSLYITVLADTDGDGVPDLVENGLGLNPSNNADGLLDLDGDGMSNGSEYRAGTLLNDSNSVLRLTQTTVPGQAMLHFGAISNRTYTLQYTDTLPGLPWQRLADVMTRTTNRVETFLDPNWTTNRFYRVVTPRAP